MTPLEAKKVIAVLTAAFPGGGGGDNTITVYAEALLDLEYELVDRAVRSLILTATKYMPRIGEIRERCIELRDGGRRTGVEAWGSVLAAMRAQGSHRTPEVDFTFIDPITMLVVKSLGWTELCAGDVDNQMSNRARFVEAYDQISRDDVRARQSGGLLPERVSPLRRLARGAVPLAQLLPGDRRDPWED